MKSREFIYYRAVTVASVFGIIVSLCGIIWISMFLSFLTQDPITVDLFSRSFNPAVTNVSAITDPNVNKGVLATSLGFHILWFHASLALGVGNNNGIVAVLWIWMILSFLVILSDFLGTIFSIVMLFKVLLKANIVIQNIFLHTQMFVFFSKFGFLLHVLLIVLIYLTWRRIKEISTSVTEIPLFDKQMPVLPIRTIHSQIEEYNKDSNETNTRNQSKKFSTRQSTIQLLSAIENYNESAKFGSHNVESRTAKYPTTSVSTIAIVDYPSTSRNLETTTL